jgi:hypothetical protein
VRCDAIVRSKNRQRDNTWAIPLVLLSKSEPTSPPPPLAGACTLRLTASSLARASLHFEHASVSLGPLRLRSSAMAPGWHAQGCTPALPGTCSGLPQCRLPVARPGLCHDRAALLGNLPASLRLARPRQRKRRPGRNLSFKVFFDSEWRGPGALTPAGAVPANKAPPRVGVGARDPTRRAPSGRRNQRHGKRMAYILVARTP